MPHNVTNTRWFRETYDQPRAWNPRPPVPFDREAEERARENVRRERARRSNRA